MKLGIMQPYFFPYLGYFSLIDATDFWVVFDEVQFIRHGWVERNRVQNSDGGWQYIKVPLVKAPRQNLIKDTFIRFNENWESKILAQLTCYKKKAPYYNQVINLLEKIFEKKNKDITSLNILVLKKVCEYIGMEFNYDVFSQTEMDFSSTIKKPGDWALQISKYYEASTYVNPYGGIDIFDRENFQKEGIGIKFLKNNLDIYNQRNKKFEPGLSIIDVLMFNSPKETKKLIESYKFC
ncbi:WbqC family protein [Flaviramulus sp. BrNp1-15]|uniref:WbqC family protein n=1 Tax=Flaviramulus sp. BrNp1-15 TaxID=2916754 RepID=UPI001EE8F270|nr:WbqC family protein [Flaviramulus sp. BrNp1-15]ULC60556.1 WbqC family protein [Flaviramulus sp. BrNp1-15]